MLCLYPLVLILILGTQNSSIMDPVNQSKLLKILSTSQKHSTSQGKVGTSTSETLHEAIQTLGFHELQTLVQILKQKADSLQNLQNSIDKQRNHCLTSSQNEFIDTLADRGFLQSPLLHLPSFSAEGRKGEVSFLAWMFEVHNYLSHHPERVVKDAIQKSLKGKAYDTLVNLGTQATLQEILEVFQIKFGIVAPYDSLMSDLYTMKQLENESVVDYETRLRSRFAAIESTYPEPQDRQQDLKDRLFFGLKDNVKTRLYDLYRTKEQKKTIDYHTILQHAREVEHQLDQETKVRDRKNRDKKDKNSIDQNLPIQKGIDSDLLTKVIKQTFGKIQTSLSKPQKKMDTWCKKRGKRSRNQNKKTIVLEQVPAQQDIILERLGHKVEDVPSETKEQSTQTIETDPQKQKDSNYDKGQDKGPDSEKDSKRDNGLENTPFKVGKRDIELLNPDAYGRLIGKHNDAPIIVDSKPTRCLLDNAAVVSTISEDFCTDNDIEVFPLEKNIPFMEMPDGTSCNYLGQCALHLQIPELDNLELDIPALVVPHSTHHELVPILLGTNILEEIAKLKEIPLLSSELDEQLLDQLPLNWQSTFKALQNSKLLKEKEQDSLGITKLSRKVTIPALGYKICTCTTKARIEGGYIANVITEPTKASRLPACIESKNPLVELLPGSSRTRVILINRSSAPVHLAKGTVVGETFLANKIPKIIEPDLEFIEKNLNSDGTQTSTHTRFQPMASVSTSDKDDREWILDKVDLSGTASWSPLMQKKARELMIEYSDIFSRHDLDLGRTHLIQHDIKLNDNVPFREAYRRIPPHLMDGVKTHLKEMEELGVIRKSYSPWASPIVLVQKKDGTLRFCIDLRKLNARTIKDNYSLPRIDHHLEQLAGAVWFTTLDLKSGYWQVELTEESKPLTAFTVGPLGFYECNAMPFGATNAPATFQRLMENCLGNLNLNWCVVYLDDIIVFGKNPEEILERLRAVFQRLREAGLKLKPSKCIFFKKEVGYLGHVVSEQGIAADPKKLEIIQNWPTPQTVHDVRSFLGYSGYYRKFAHNFSKLAKGMSNLLVGLESTSKRIGKITPVRWTQKEQTSFDNVKKAFKNPPVLGFADFKRSFILYIDCDKDGLSASLYQEDLHQKLRLIAHASRSLIPAEQNYSEQRLRFLTLKWAVTSKFNEYLYGAQQPCEIFCQDNPLDYVLTSNKLSATSQRWIAELSNYKFTIAHCVDTPQTDIGSEQGSVVEEKLTIPQSMDDVSLDRQNCEQIVPGIVGSILAQTALPPKLINCMAIHPKAVPQVLLEYEQNKQLGNLDWVKEQAADPVLKHLKQAMTSGQRRYFGHILARAPKDVREELSKHQSTYFQYKIVEGLLYREIKTPHTKSGKQLQLLLPKQLIPKVLQGCHDDIGHMSKQHTLHLIKERFFFVNMYQTVSEYVLQCKVCREQSKVEQWKPPSTLDTQKPMELIYIDFMTLDFDSEDEQTILVVTDHFTGFAQAYPVKDDSVETAVHRLEDRYFQHYGYPEHIASCQGSSFNTTFVEKLCKLKGIDRIRTNPIYQDPGEEQPCFNRVLVDMIKTLEKESRWHWKDYLPSMVHAYNCVMNARTGYSPYYIMFSRHPRLPIDKELGIYKHSDKASLKRGKYLERIHDSMKKAQVAAQKYSAQDRARKQKYYDQNQWDLQIGDLVLAQVAPAPQMSRKKTKKLTDRWEIGEFIVVDKPLPNAPMYTVEPVSSTQNKSETKTLHRKLLLPIGVSLGTQESTVDTNGKVESTQLKSPVSTSTQKESSTQHTGISSLSSEDSVVKDQSEAALGLNEFCDMQTDLFDSDVTQGKSGSTDEESIPDTSNLADTSVQNILSSGTGMSNPDQDSELGLNPADLDDILEDTSHVVSSQKVEDATESGISSSVPNRIENLIDDVVDSPQSVDQENGMSQQDIPTIEESQQRVSKRSTKGSIPTRLGSYITHRIGCIVPKVGDYKFQL